MIPKNKKEEIIFEGELYSKQSLNKDLSQYRYLLITYAVYDYLNNNTCGASNILIMDLTKKGTKVTDYQISTALPYGIFSDTGANIGANMSVGFIVNAAKSTFKPLFAYNGTVQESTVTQYYVSKIVGIV
ncbi:MAG: hypothetical protein J6K45_04810 [Clostridia bacterium]|nr:hypothetical protein [Clostridia bacterium]